jgi:tetratricopeptide (TPR) repeat protein
VTVERSTLELLDHMLDAYPQSSELAAAHWCRADCLAGLGQLDEAFEALRTSLATERDAPNWRTTAYLTFGWLAIRHRRTDLYDEALAALDEFGGRELLPRQQYEAAAIRALVFEAKGDHHDAASSARRALDAAAKTDSGLRYHKHLGLVVERDPRIHRELERLAKLRPS